MNPSFEDLLLPQLPAAYRIAYNLTRNKADAEDAVQEAALQAQRGFGGFTAGTNFRAWFFRIVMNACYARHRSAKRRPETTSFEEVPEIYLFEKSVETGLPVEGVDPARAVLDRLSAEQVMDAIASLPDEFRMVATLYFLQEMKYEEIAEILGVPVGTVRSRLHRGRRLLQMILWKAAQDAGLRP
jgi:RNA polymerase sigma-70 factor (ECF subfamily)